MRLYCVLASAGLVRLEADGTVGAIAGRLCSVIAQQETRLEELRVPELGRSRAGYLGIADYTAFVGEASATPSG